MRNSSLNKPVISLLVMASILSLAAGQAMAGEIKLAVASNFASAITAIAERFEANTGHKVKLIFGSTGKHYAQIRNGAPFDAYFAADARRPDLLEQEGLALPGTRFTYAIGKVILWSPVTAYVDEQAKVLEQREFRHLAIANPKLAPYGRAAREVLQARGLWDSLRGSMVRGENIGQTFQFVKSGNAELGFVAYAQVKQPGQPMQGSWWEVPQALYTPIEQQAVLLREGEAARAFMSYIQSDEALEIIQDYGYGAP